MKKAMHVLAIMAAYLLAAMIIFCQDAAENDSDGGTIQTDEDALFGSDEDDEDALFGGQTEGIGAESDLIDDMGEGDLATSLEKVLLTSEGVDIGGRYSFSASSNWLWHGSSLSLGYLAENLQSPTTASIGTNLGLSLSLDARPNEDFRVLGKMEIGYPLSWDTVRLTELFSDFDWADAVFFRVGKQTAEWGVGYYFSPADVVSLTPIDPEDPAAEREGPVALKVQVPYDVHNAYLYVIVQDITKPEQLGFAPKLEFVLGSSEIGIGGIFRPDLLVRPRGVLTATFPLLDADGFGEAVFSYGSERTFVEEAGGEPLGVAAIDKQDQLFFWGTLGIRYSYSDEDGNWNLNITGQYLYNGDGYTDPGILSEHATAVSALIAQRTLASRDLIRPGLHYGAANVSLRNILQSDLTASLFWMGNLSDGSGRATPLLSWTISPDVSLSLQVPVSYGETGDEYTPRGISVSPSFAVRAFDKTSVSFGVPLIFADGASGVLSWTSVGFSVHASLGGGSF